MNRRINFWPISKSVLLTWAGSVCFTHNVGHSCLKSHESRQVARLARVILWETSHFALPASTSLAWQEPQRPVTRGAKLPVRLITNRTKGRNIRVRYKRLQKNGSQRIKYQNLTIAPTSTIRKEEKKEHKHVFGLKVHAHAHVMPHPQVTFELF